VLPRDSSAPCRSPRPHHRIARAAIVGVALAATIPALPAHAATSRSECAADGLLSYAVVRGDSWFDIAARAGVSRRSLYDANDATTESVLLAGSTICLPSNATALSSCAGGSYEVRRNDSWSALAEAAGVSLRTFLDANDASTSTALHPGDDVCLPEGASITSARTASGGSSSSSSSSSGVLQAAPAHGPCYFEDTWRDARPGGRFHQGVDLIAAEGNYVYAVVDGTLTRRVWDIPSRISGNGWWLTAGDGSGTTFFYGHLLDFAPGLEVGDTVAAGEIIGFVGNTGRSSTAHLHFEILPNGGAAVNPTSAVAAVGGCKTGDGYRQPSGWVP
jgi:murein DD-endopeptidase MepM/ murein hydrolase activator NlpD